MLDTLLDTLTQHLPQEALPENAVQLFALVATLICYFLARYFYLRLNKTPLLQPMLVATPLLILLISVTKVSLSEYQQGTDLLTWMIAPLAIALMVPLAENIKEIKSLLPAILFTLLVCTSFTVGITLLLAAFLGANELSLLSLATKSVTTPVALLISEEINSLASLAALIVIVTGVMGVLTAPVIFSVLRVKDERAKGITLGLSAHIIGSAYAFEQSRRYAAFSVVSMSITALLSALFLPAAMKFFF